jgi:hypothetical protein
MTATIKGQELVNEIDELALEDGSNATEELTVADERFESSSIHAPLPWIGALPNPRLGPMVVVNDGGYFVPVFTAVDLVRGCRYFWRRTLE